MGETKSGKITVALIGAGLRGQIYTNYAIDHPDRMQVVAVADPNAARTEAFSRRHGIGDSLVFRDWRELLARPKLADAVVICTQDKMHYEPTMKALDAGYHVLLEKPMSPDPEECVRMGEKAAEAGLVFSICHVLRYTAFFGTLKRLLDDGAIGQLMSIQHNENVGYWHQAHSFVRGNWRNAAESSPMILAKSCHDMDILLWLAGADCVRLSSFGALSHFRAEHAPAGAPARCTDGCPAADNCLYYAPNVYLGDEPGWMALAISDDPSREARMEALRTGPYGRCVYRCDNDVVDHQVVNMEFANAVTAVFTMSAFTQECSRTLKLMGTQGEIRAAMEKNEIELIRFGAGKPERIGLEMPGGHIGHGGGDLGLIRDFAELVRARRDNDAGQDNGRDQDNGAGRAGVGLTSAVHSVQSHLMAFAAEQSRLEGKVVELDRFRQQIMRFA
ncbi:Gfo/Idh/MocA family oxidoreductase [Paenibacillus lycopersici]|uniref:Gfo/Idh/MocA family oxidoreductase n=1 Tax=Paenibacillus lycopersici TaxID=2704462 RepID=A0A6C0FPY1_9BACL|nr:Gfo/Idh/MocA family oxidoreductase [Paenibacillus lycopersici]QHT58947.1 Gfo/Idh/MocA family oxidoreductase [Paenibacillus lycopersici]